jgi:hypothetical protein
MTAAVLAILLSLPRTPGDETEPAADRAARLNVLATAIDTASKSNPGIAGALIEQANSESNLDGAVAQCQCKRHQCDPLRSHGGIVFRAHGYFQQHNAPHTWAPTWWESFCSPLDTTAQTIAARLIASRIDVTKLECSFARLKGLTVPCDAPWAVARAKRAREFAARLRSTK